MTIESGHAIARSWRSPIAAALFLGAAFPGWASVIGCPETINGSSGGTSPPVGFVSVALLVSSEGGSTSCTDSNTASGILVTRGNLSVPSNVMASFAIGGAGGGKGTGRVSLKTGETGLAASAGGGKWNVWGAYGRNNVSNEFVPLQSGGDVDAAMLGADYTLANGLIVGAALSFERTRIATPYNGGSVNGDGYSVAPYLSWQIDRNWSLDATLGWGQTDIDSNFGGGVTGSNNDDRFFGGVTGAYVTERGPWILTGRASYLYGRDKFDAFTASDGTAIPSHDSRIGQFRIGGQVGYAGDGFMPYVGLYYVYDSQHDDLPTIGGQTPANDRSAFQAQIGINLFSRGGLSGGVMWATEFNRDQSKNDQFLLNASYRF